jgi:glycosyltransferase involved in cell wall biosynthesis
MVFENNSLLPRQVQSFRILDAILVPSTFCRNACLSSGVPRSRVFMVSYPLGEEWSSDVAAEMGPGERTRFLYLNTWYERKGCDVMMRAWWKAFSSSDRVELWIKTYKEEGRVKDIEADISEMALRAGVDRKREAPIHVIDEILPDSRMPAFMRSFDCYVSPHRSEGFGMNVWHAMALGVPVVCTDYGGVTDFARPDTAWLAKASRMTSPSTKELSLFPHLAGISWAEPDIEDLARRMREVIANPAERARRAEKARTYVRTHYAPDVVAGDFRRALVKTAPGAWDALLATSSADALAAQPSQKYESNDSPVRLVEI